MKLYMYDVSDTIKMHVAVYCLLEILTLKCITS